MLPKETLFIFKPVYPVKYNNSGGRQFKVMKPVNLLVSYLRQK